MLTSWAENSAAEDENCWPDPCITAVPSIRKQIAVNRVEKYPTW